MMPPDASERLKLAMQDAVDYEINDLRERILWKRRREEGFLLSWSGSGSGSGSGEVEDEDEETFRDEVEF